MKHLMASIIFITIIVSFAASAFASWLIYHKSAFRGKVIDANTKEPIESAVVVVLYNKHTLISGPGGGDSSIVHIKEVLTNKKGEFFFPSYTTVIQPNSIEFDAEFIIYKPGYLSFPRFWNFPRYGNFPNYKVSPPRGMSSSAIERFFSAETFGQKGDIIIETGQRRNSKRKVTFGVMELPPLKTRKERLRAIPGRPTDFRSGKLPLLYKLINEERKRFGLGEVR